MQSPVEGQIDHRTDGDLGHNHTNCPSLSRPVPGCFVLAHLNAGAIQPRVNANEFPPPAAPREAAALATGGNWPRTDTSCAGGGGGVDCCSPAWGWGPDSGVSGGEPGLGAAGLVLKSPLSLRTQCVGACEGPKASRDLVGGGGAPGRGGEGPGRPERPRVKTSGLGGWGWAAGSPGRR